MEYQPEKRQLDFNNANFTFGFISQSGNNKVIVAQQTWSDVSNYWIPPPLVNDLNITKQYDTTATVGTLKPIRVVNSFTPTKTTKTFK